MRSSSIINVINMQKLKWVCDKCGWEYEVYYSPSPNNMDKLLNSIMPLHMKEHPDCPGDSGDVICHHMG